MSLLCRFPFQADGPEAYPGVRVHLRAGLGRSRGWALGLLGCLLALLGSLTVGRAQAADYSNWMRDHWDTIKGKTLRQLVIPATHDSGSYDLVNPWEILDYRWYSVGADFAGPDTDKDAVKWVNSGPFFEHWSQTQSKRIYDQLTDGIRALDLRAAVDPQGNFRIVHSLYGDTIDIVLDDILKFSREHPEELIHVRFDHFHDYSLRTTNNVEGGKDKMSYDHHESLRDLIRDKIGDRLILDWRPDKTLEQLREANSSRRILLFYSETVANGRYAIPARDGFISGSSIANNEDWVGDTEANLTPESFKALTLAKIQRFRGGSQLHRLGAVTPHRSQYDAWHQDGSIAGTNPKSLAIFASDTNPVIAKWIRDEWASLELNVIQMDYYPDYLVPLCLQLNGIEVPAFTIPEDKDWGAYKNLSQLAKEADTAMASWIDSVDEVKTWFDQLWANAGTFFKSIADGIASVFTQTFEPALAGTPPADGVAAGVRHYVITAQRIEVLSAPADWEGDLELYGQIFMVPSPFAFTDPGANKTLWSLPEGDQGRTKIGSSLQINASKNLYVKEEEAKDLQVAMGGVLYDDEFGLFAGLGDHLLELDLNYRQVPLTFDLGSLEEGEAITESVIYSKPNVAQVAVYFRAERRVAPLIPKAPPFEWTLSARRGVTVDRQTRVGTGLLAASSRVPGRVEYLPAEGTFLPPGSRGEVFATFIPDDSRRYLEQTISRSVVVPQVVRPVPGKIEAENFDAFFEAGGTMATPETSDGGGGKEVASLPAGGWVAYQISATADYQYVPWLRVATVNPRQQLRLQVDGQVVGADIHLPFTGGLGAWLTVELPALPLTAGFHRVQVEWLTSGTSLNYLEFVFPPIEEYVQNFDAFADGTTGLQDGSTLTSTHLGQAAQVRSGALRLGDDQVANSTSTFTLPALSANGLPTYTGFETSFDYQRSGLFSPENFSFNYGGLSVRFDAGAELKTVVVSVQGQPLPDGSARVPLLDGDVRHRVSVRWSKQNGSGRLSVLVDGVDSLTEIATPGFAPSASDVMALVARNGGGILATVEIDNLRVAKLPPETRVLAAEIGSADLGLVELGSISFPFTLRNEGNAPVTVRSLVPSEGSTSENGFVLRPGEVRQLKQYLDYRGDGPYHVTLDIFSDATAGVDARGAQRLEFDVLVSGTPSGAQLMARFPLDSDGDSDDHRFVASEVRDVAFVAGGARAGSVGSAVFNGTSSRILHPWNDLLNPRQGTTAGSFTVSAWVKAEAVATFQGVVSSGQRTGPDTTGYGLSTGSGTAWEYWTGNGSGGGEAPVVRGSTPRFGEWQHVAAVYDAGRQRKTLFVDGEPVATQEVAVAPNLDRVLNLGSGGNNGDSAFFRGAMDDVAIFAGAMTRAEVARVMAGDYAPFEPPPGDRILGVVGGSSTFGTVEAIDGRIRGRWILQNTGTAPITIRKFILPPGVTLDWNGGTLAPQQTREMIVTKEVTGPGLVAWQIIANSDGNVSVDDQGNTYFTLNAVAQVASFVVTTTVDSGPGSLRQVLAEAAAHPGGDTVTFAPGFTGPIQLQSELLLQDSNRITLEATEFAHGVTVEGNGTHRLIRVSPETVAQFNRLNLAGGVVGSGFPDGYGGGLFVEGVLTLNGCTLTRNNAYAGGAAFVVASPTSSLTLNRCTVSHNAASFGGGIQSEGLLVIASSTLALNTASVVGGAISSPSTTLTLIQTTVAQNTAGQGGGIFGTEITLQNSIVAGNTAATDPNLVGNVTAKGVNWTDGDPLLAALADNGGPTETMALLPNSPGLNAAKFTNASTDQRGLPISGAPDLGAFEAQPDVVVFVNQAPSFVRGADQSVVADSGAQTIVGWATEISAGAAEESAQVLTFSVSTDRPDLFRSPPVLAANGTLTFAPAPDGQGVATVTVQLRDDGGTQNGGVDTSVAQTFRITVVAPIPKDINDAPSFTVGPDPTVNSSSGPQAVNGWATAISAGPASESAQTLTFLVSVDQPSLFAEVPVIDPSGKLTFTPAANANGTAVVTVRLQDNGGTADGGVDTSVAQTFRITVVTPVVGDFLVTNANDSGPGSLRQALADAATRPGADRIAFASGFQGPIRFTTVIEIADADGVSIDASGEAAGVTLSGGNAHRLFKIAAGSKAEFRRLKLTECAIGGGYPDGYGGAVSVEGELTLIECSLTGNSASVGGAIALANNGVSRLIAERCTFAGNTAEHGGAIQAEGRVTANASTFAGNSASVMGGAISAAFGNEVKLTHCTVSGNSAAQQGGGIIGENVALQYSIVAGNTAPVDANISGVPIVSGVNLTSGDPQLAALADNGGPTLTLALRTGSPARDAATGSSVTTDQRGQPMNGVPDLGAFEWQPGSPVQPVLSIQPAGANLIVSWDRSDGYVLEQTPSMGSGATWTTVPHTTVGNTSGVVLTISPGSSRFFRLRAPQSALP